MHLPISETDMLTKVLHVFGAMDVGGAELRTLELAEALRHEDVEFHYLTLSGRRGVLANRIEATGGQIHPLRLSPLFPIRYIRLLRRLEPTVIDSHVATFSGALLCGAWFAGVPSRIAHFRSDGDLHGSSIRRKAQRSFMRFLINQYATAIVGVSPGALTNGYSRSWRSNPRARIIPNGFTVKTSTHTATASVEPEGQYSRRVGLIHVGRPSLEKNRQRTIEILHQARNEGIDAYLTMVGGTGADEQIIADSINEFNLESFVVNTGYQEDPWMHLAKADCLLLTSTREGLPGVVLEALAVGTPALCARLPGVLWIAEQFPLCIRTVSLEAPNSEWVDALRLLLNDWPGRGQIIDTFASSRFSFTLAVDSHRELYMGRKS